MQQLYPKYFSTHDQLIEETGAYLDQKSACERYKDALRIRAMPEENPWI